MGALSLAGRILKKATHNKKGEFSVIATGGTLFSGYMGLETYQGAREEGNSVVSSTLQAGVDTALWYVAPWLYGTAQVVSGLGGAVFDGYVGLKQYARQVQKQRRNIPFANATFVDSQQTYTMRQAGMNLARQGQYAAAQTTLGNEAASVSYMGR